MRLVCGTCSAVFEASSNDASESSPRCRACGRVPRADAEQVRADASRSPRECWFVRNGERRDGPFGPAEFARLLTRGQLSWSTEVWREGLTDFRPARRDELLVLGVARVRGLGDATLRLDGLPSLLQSSDTKLVVAPIAVREAAPRAPASERPSPGTLLEARRETTLDATPNPIRTSVAPAQPARPSLPHDEATVVTAPRSRSALPWLLVAFIAGAAAAFSPVTGRELAQALPQWVRRASRPLPPAAAQLQSQVTPHVEPAATLVTVEPLAAPAHALPSPEELRGALKSASPRLFRCLRRPALGLAVELTFSGDSGRVRDAAVSDPPLRAGELECVLDTLSDVHVEPFGWPELRHKHRYAW